MVKSGFQALSTWKKGRLWETMFASAKSDLGAHRFYEDSLNDDLDTPVKVQAEILRRLVLVARERTGEDPRKSRVVITVPASFEMGQRKDTLNAAELAGLNVGDGDLMDEPNAAFLDRSTLRHRSIGPLGGKKPPGLRFRRRDVRHLGGVRQAGRQ